MQKVLIVKPDHIGDYILFRNFFKEIKESRKFKGSELIVFLNNRVKDLAELIDSEIVDRFIWVDLEKFVRGEWYFKRKIQEVASIEYDFVINAMFARMNPIEILISEIVAKEKILIKGGLKERPLCYVAEEKSIYTSIVDVSKKQLFEFERFRFALEKICENNMVLKSPNLYLPEGWYDALDIKNEYCVVFIGADALFRKWPLSYFKDVIEHILSYYSFDIIILGGTEERKDAEELMQSFQTSRLIDLTSETTLLDVVAILNKATFVISNETGVAHIATLLGKTTIVISNGNHFGKFTPYPRNYEMDYLSVYPFELDLPMAYQENLQRYYDGSGLDINLIKSEKVIKMITSICERKNILQNELRRGFSVVTNSNIGTFSSKQTALNYHFSSVLSQLCFTILEYKKNKHKIIVYGNGYFGQFAKHLLAECGIGIVDKNSFLQSCSPNNTEVFSTESLRYFRYDKIFISVLGRENEIIKYLQDEYNVSIEKILTIKISQGRYFVGC